LQDVTFDHPAEPTFAIVQDASRTPVIPTRSTPPALA
jgi:hypothetical protein